MSLLDAYTTLARLGPTLTTAEAAAALHVPVSSASRLLPGLAERGLVLRLRHGLWATGPLPVDPLRLAAEVTRPHPAYVSFASALNAHGMIDQRPRQVTLASLDRARRIVTAVATYAVHHLPPQLFGGWIDRDGVLLATPEKAIVDLAYVSAAHAGRLPLVPEIDLPADFDHAALDGWIGQVPSERLRTLTTRGVEAVLARAAT